MKGVTILIVEDEPIVAKDIENCLKKLGHTILGVVSEGEKALKMIETLKPDLILMDITLKGKMDGIDVANQIKEQNKTPVVFLTANTDKSTFEKAKLSEPYGYIIKPFKEIDLFTAIEIATQKHNQDVNIRNEKQLLYSFPESRQIEDVLFVKSNYTLVKVNINDLIFVEALKDYVIFNTKTARYVIHSTMKNMEEKLLSRNFIRVHRSYIVRLNDVQSVTPQSLTLESIAKEIPIGGSYKEGLLKKLKRM
jgi:two-component system, LytTR family, response regulator LytT